ncbi:hypothetical protein C0J52_16094 [Blattella germanica]|nr:hypothetical protein C0J52_16094 [Blattella germanica]
MESKKKFFTAEEKTYITDLVCSYKDIIENKKSDVVSTTAKRRKWQEIADEYNLTGQYSKRSAEQLKKCWENMKTKRKSELAVEKRQRMFTGGGPCSSPRIDDEPQLDSLIESIDIKMSDVVDNDTLFLVEEDPASSACIIKEEESLDVDSLQKQKEIEMPKESIGDMGKNMRTTNENVRTACITREAEKRLERYFNLQNQDNELHKLRVEEIKFRVKTAEEEYENMKEKRMHEQAMRALELQFMRDKLEQHFRQFEKHN